MGGLRISTLIKTFYDLGTFPSKGCVDRIDIINSLNGVENLKMVEFTFEECVEYFDYSNLQSFINQNRYVRKVWLQVYFQIDIDLHDAILYKILELVFDRFSRDTEIIWNVHYGKEAVEKSKFKCVIIYC